MLNWRRILESRTPLEPPASLTIDDFLKDLAGALRSRKHIGLRAKRRHQVRLPSSVTGLSSLKVPINLLEKSAAPEVVAGLIRDLLVTPGHNFMLLQPDPVSNKQRIATCAAFELPGHEVVAVIAKFTLYNSPKKGKRTETRRGASFDDALVSLYWLPFDVACPSCGEANPPNLRICGACECALEAQADLETFVRGPEHRRFLKGLEDLYCDAIDPIVFPVARGEWDESKSKDRLVPTRRRVWHGVWLGGEQGRRRLAGWAKRVQAFGATQGFELAVAPNPEGPFREEAERLVVKQTPSMVIAVIPHVGKKRAMYEILADYRRKETPLEPILIEDDYAELSDEDLIEWARDLTDDLIDAWKTESFLSLSDALEAAEKRFRPTLEIFKDAKQSAKTARCRLYGKAFQMLEAANDACLKWFAEDGCDLEGVFDDWGFHYANIETGYTMSRADRWFERADGKKVEMEKHMKLGIGNTPPERCLRLYFEVDPENQLFQIGYFGDPPKGSRSHDR